MRQMIFGLVAAAAVVAASAAPAMACGDIPCGPVYIPAPVYTCYTGCGGWGFERLPDPVQQYHPIRQSPVQQYYYADQGPTYTGPGNFAPYPVYREGGVSGWYHRPHYYGYHHHAHHGPVLRRYY
jgi:hypothetical protein